ncbi:Hpt domain-containing protein [Roseomonas sp. NAR14]|uniref:Hpt domain-containing protein n=1 Tax=Roseomonas acroporae TaxID=2937791 RepID=A0A9X2BZA0_9PROT|nr:Hpt domain-containing protein [Roseomonas acroporae]MCK8786840.1 Hpt domain-containing protein [Roseomonas acroporae]
MSGIDPDTAAQLAASLRPSDLQRILLTFEADLADLAGQIEAAARTGDAETYRRAAHSLAGAAASVGAFALERAARLAMSPDAAASPAEVLGRIRGETGAALRDLARLAAVAAG